MQAKSFCAEIQLCINFLIYIVRPIIKGSENQSVNYSNHHNKKPRLEPTSNITQIETTIANVYVRKRTQTEIFQTNQKSQPLIYLLFVIG